jgi:transposase
MIRWAEPVCGRDQIVLFSPSLQDAISQDHSVRLFDEVIGKLDFAEWEQYYQRADGRPPIHPRVMAQVILYGLSLGIRSSRKLEDACINRIDFWWLTEGRSIDHSTLAGFRVKFAEKLKGMFGQIGRVAMNLGMVNLNQVALDGTAKRASNSRYAVSRKVNLQEKLAALDQQIAGLMDESLATDKQENELFGESSPTQLPRDLRDLKARQKRLEKAMKKVLAIEAKQKAAGRLSESGPATPTTDPDANLMKNKTGGFAPNHLVVLATEGKSGLIVDYQVPENPDEPSSVLPAVANIRESFGADAVKDLLADSAFNTGSNLDALKTAEIQPWMPPKRSAVTAENPVTAPENSPTPPDAKSAAETTSQPTSQLTPQSTPQPADTGKSKVKPFDKSLFVFQPASDTYQCPAGRSMTFWKNSSEKREGGTVQIRVYRSTDCSSCALANRCISDRNKTKIRTIGRDQHEPLREEMAARMNTEQGRSIYRRRSFLAETPFAVLNTSMNVIQLLLRGTEKVTAEVGWICSAYNIKKITRLLAISRQPAVANGS